MQALLYPIIVYPALKRLGQTSNGKVARGWKDKLLHSLVQFAAGTMKLSLHAIRSQSHTLKSLIRRRRLC